ncbi:hypothetical protein KUCAC02_026923 [Chaenocephalus aceratus]|nr:hypothetical protein KUCAC02_026923 [Chaenocephalus aceratus]
MSSVQLVSVVLVLLALLLDSGTSLVLPMDCSDIYNNDNNRPSGVYTIYPIGSTSAVQYFPRCSRGGWTASVNFFRPWDHYKTGFGNAVGEYWLGLESSLPPDSEEEVRAAGGHEDFEGGKAFARYSSFSVDPRPPGDALTRDSLSYHNGQKFSTFDKDQDSSPSNCARTYLGAFWYNTCHYTNPNGGDHYSLKSISMKVRPVQ